MAVEGKVSMAGTSALSPAAGLDTELEVSIHHPTDVTTTLGKVPLAFHYAGMEPRSQSSCQGSGAERKNLHSNQARLTPQSMYLTLQPCPLLAGPRGQSGICRLVCINAAQKLPQIPSYLFRCHHQAYS